MDLTRLRRNTWNFLKRTGKKQENSWKSCIEGMEQKKKELLEKYLDELKDIAVAIAEKVIRVSLRTSGETMKHMIASAAGELEKKRNGLRYMYQNMTWM